MQFIFLSTLKLSIASSLCGPVARGDCLQSTPFRELEEAAERLAQQGDYQEAERLYRQALRLEPTSSPLTRVALAKVLAGKGDVALAEAQLRSAIRHCLEYKSSAAALQGVLEGAALFLAQFVSLEKAEGLLLEHLAVARASSVTSLAEIAMAKKSFETAERLYKAGAERERHAGKEAFPRAVRSGLAYAAFLQTAGRSEKAERQLQRLLQEHRCAETLVAYAEFLMKARDYTQAWALLEEAKTLEESEVSEAVAARLRELRGWEQAKLAPTWAVCFAWDGLPWDASVRAACVLGRILLHFWPGPKPLDS